MKKVLVLMILGMTIYSFGAGFKSSIFKKTIKNVPTSQLSKSIKIFKKSPNMTKIGKGLKLKKVVDPIEKLTQTAEVIAKKSPTANKLMGTSDPLYAMSLYAKGGDKLFKDIGIAAKQTMKVSSDVVMKMKNKMPSVPKIPKLSEGQLYNKIIEVTKRTGKFGVDVVKGVAKVAKNNPKSAVAGILYGWYLSDPVGFKNKLNEFGGSIEEFAKEVGRQIGQVVASAAKGIIEGIVQAVTETLSPTALLILIGGLLTWLLFKFRGILGLNQILVRGEEDSNSSKGSSKKRGGRF